MQLMDASPRLVVREMTVAGGYEVIEGFAVWYNDYGDRCRLAPGDEPLDDTVDEIESLGVEIRREGCRYDPND